MNALTDVALLRLLSLSSQGLPVGAFAYSQGLEYAVLSDWVSDEASALAWVKGIFNASLACLDLPVLARLYAAWDAKDRAEVFEQTRFLLACRESRELVMEDQHLGRALARVLVGHGIEEASPWTRHPDATFAALYALGAVKWRIPARAALLGYAYTWAEAQSAALSRLLPLGQLAVQRILWNIVDSGGETVDTALALADDDVGAFAPTHAVASILHETQYSRLFRS